MDFEAVHFAVFPTDFAQPFVAFVGKNQFPHINGVVFTFDVAKIGDVVAVLQTRGAFFDDIFEPLFFEARFEIFGAQQREIGDIIGFLGFESTLKVFLHRFFRQNAGRRFDFRRRMRPARWLREANGTNRPNQQKNKANFHHAHLLTTHYIFHFHHFKIAAFEAFESV